MQYPSLIIIGNKIVCEEKLLEIANNLLDLKNNEVLEHPDYHHIQELEKQTIGIDQVREIQKIVQLKPYNGKSKIVHISQAGKLTPQAQNALLKVLEEPPLFTQIILSTTNKYQLLGTIRSRCITKEYNDYTNTNISIVIDSVEYNAIGIVNSTLQKKYNLVDKVMSISNPIEKKDSAKGILNILARYYTTELRKTFDTDYREKIKNILKLINNISQGINKNANLKLSLESVLVNI